MAEAIVRILPRVHIGLISMHETGPRRNGGVGFALSEPATLLTFVDTGEFTIEDRREKGLGQEEVGVLKSMLSDLRTFAGLPLHFAVAIDGHMPTHHGLGSGTAIRLACVEALFAINGRNLSREDAVRLSGRGGTSGVGVNTYFEGGLVLDLGKASTPGSTFTPSSRATAKTPPLKLVRYEMPNWRVGLCIPRRCKAKTQAEEVEFFARATPLTEAASYEAAYHALFGITAAVAERDYAAFCASIDRMQTTQWKMLERLEYGEALVDADRTLRRVGADAVGMSSLGPLLYFFGDEETMDRAMALSGQMDWEIFVAETSNGGRQWQVG